MRSQEEFKSELMRRCEEFKKKKKRRQKKITCAAAVLAICVIAAPAAMLSGRESDKSVDLINNQPGVVDSKYSGAQNGAAGLTGDATPSKSFNTRGTFAKEVRISGDFSGGVSEKIYTDPEKIKVIADFLETAEAQGNSVKNTNTDSAGVTISLISGETVKIYRLEDNLLYDDLGNCLEVNSEDLEKFREALDSD